eukprot:SAG31_NODE_35922_length_318_cov_0.885845_1_plen_30_part_01
MVATVATDEKKEDEGFRRRVDDDAELYHIA